MARASNRELHSTVPGLESARFSDGAVSLPVTDESIPILSVFDNAILASDTQSTFNHSIHGEFNGEYPKVPKIEIRPNLQRPRLKRAKVCEALTYLLPPYTAIYAILEAGGF